MPTIVSSKWVKFALCMVFRTSHRLKPSVAFLTTIVSLECMGLVTSWQCVVSSMGNAWCMVCNVWNITQVEAKYCRISTVVSLEYMVLLRSC